MRSLLLLAAMLALAPANVLAAEDCVDACLAAKTSPDQDHFVRADAARNCRDQCTSEALASIKASPLADAYRACKPAELTREEFRELRGASPSWKTYFNMFMWQIRNVRKDIIVTGIEVATQDMNLSIVQISAEGIVPPDGMGTFVIPDFFDGYPAVRYATRVTRIFGCRL